jgi:hypothetical protein
MYRGFLFLLILLLALFIGCSQTALITLSTTQEPSLITSTPAHESLPSVSLPDISTTTTSPILTSVPSITPQLTQTISPPAPVITPQVIPLAPIDAFMKGIWFNDQPWTLDKPRPPIYGPMYYPGQADVSMKSLATTGASWISVVVHIFQEKATSTDIIRNQYGTASDAALRHIIELAHSLGIRVVLVPGIDLSNDPGRNWTQIGWFFDESQWQAWFASYREQVNHYASLSQDAGADMFYVGSELPGTTHREDDWRRIVREVRERFKGPISYDSLGGLTGLPNHEVEQIQWWDAVDYIATDFWRPLTDKNNPTVKELKQGWINTGYLISLEKVSTEAKKPVILSEIGYNSHDGTNRDPGGKSIKTMPEDLQEQADCYQAAMEVLTGMTWIKGIFWWQWNSISTTWSEDPRGKPAEEVLRNFYLQR